MSVGPRFSPFSNGSEYDGFLAGNCGRCRLRYDDSKPPINPAHPWEGPCSMENALSAAAASDGTIDRALAERIGIVVEPYEHLGPCKELKPK